jgi:hypothetical protein
MANYKTNVGFTHNYFEADGLDKLILRLENLETVFVEGMRPANEAIVQEFRIMEAQRFAAQGPAHEFGITSKWRLNTESTIARKGLKPVLVDKGYLKKAAINPKTRFTKNAVAISISPKDQGSKKDFNYGIVHQNDPGRQFITINKVFSQIAKAIVMEYINSNGLKGANKRRLPAEQKFDTSTIKASRTKGARGREYRRSVERQQQEAAAIAERNRIAAESRAILRESRDILGGRSIRSRHYQAEYDRQLALYYKASTGRGVRATENRIAELRGAMKGKNGLTRTQITMSRGNAQTLVPGTKMTYEEARSLLKAETRFQNSLRKGW